MSKRRKTGGRDFPPGVSGNPGGAPKIPEDIKAARRMNRVELERILNKFLHLPMNEIAVISKDKTLPALEYMIANLVAKDHDKPSISRISFLLDRLGFVVVQDVQVSGKEDAPAVKIFTDEQITRMAKAALNER